MDSPEIYFTKVPKCLRPPIRPVFSQTNRSISMHNGPKCSCKAHVGWGSCMMIGHLSWEKIDLISLLDI